MGFPYSFYAFLLCWGTIIIDGKQFRFDYDYYQEADGWLKLHEIPATWTDARLRCFREGAVLASPENEDLATAMKRIYKISHSRVPRGIFTGTHATYAKGYYYSIEGTPLSRMPVRWAPDEPDNADNAEDCLLMLPNGTYADVNCSDVHPYVCYKRKTPDMVLTNCGTVDKEYKLDPRTGSCYKFHTEPQVWSRAFAACAGEGGHLAIINSEVESQVLKELYAMHPESSLPGNFIKYIVHVGHSDWGEHGLWMTVHGQTLQEAGFSNWSPSQPDNSSTQFCGSIFANGLLDDSWCGTPCAFICEKRPDSLLADDEI